jgi:hypothetical protein
VDGASDRESTSAAENHSEIVIVSTGGLREVEHEPQPCHKSHPARDPRLTRLAPTCCDRALAFGAMKSSLWRILVLVLVACGDDGLAPGDTSTGGSTDATSPSTSTSSATSPSTSASTSSATEESSTTEASSTTEDTTTTDATTTDSSSSSSESTAESDTSSSTTAVVECGNDSVEDREQCDGPDLDGNDCTTIGYPAGGELSCADDCTFDPFGCFGPLCGDGVIDEPESCDGLDLAGNDCEVMGYDGGMLGCTDTCTLDLSGCHYIEPLQNDNGNCGFYEIGCGDETGTFGNPLDLLECYSANVLPPLEIVSVEYFLGAFQTPLPDALELVVHEWAGPGNAPGDLIDSVELDPIIEIVSGGYVLVLATPITSDEATFCIGFHGEDPLDGFRVEFTNDDGLVGESWYTAEACNIPDPIELTELSASGNFCIRPTVYGH